MYVAGPSGFMLCLDGGRWWEIGTDTVALITGAVCVGPDLYVTTDTGMVRRYDGRRWTTVAFSAFGPLNSICYAGGVLWACGARGIVLQHQPDQREGE